MKLIININNKIAYTLIFLLVIVIAGLGTYALAPGIDTSKGYHESNQISIIIDNQEKTLQEAIDDGTIAGSSDFDWLDLGLSGTGYISDTGFQKLPSGLIIQWGETADVSQAGDLVVSYPLPFPTKALSVVITQKKVGTGEHPGNTVHSITNNQFTIHNGHETSPFYWVAIGH